MFSPTQENRFNTKYTVSTTGLGLFPVTVSIIKCTLIGRLLWSGVHIESGKSILFKITGNSQLSHARKKKRKEKSPNKHFIVYYLEIQVSKAQSVYEGITQRRL